MKPSLFDLILHPAKNTRFSRVDILKDRGRKTSGCLAKERGSNQLPENEAMGCLSIMYDTRIRVFELNGGGNDSSYYMS